MNDDTLRQLTHERLLERRSEAQRERLALQLRTPRRRRPRPRVDTGMLGHLFAMRRHAL